MLSPFTVILIKIFAKGFYRVHSGLLLFLFVTFISYCFFIEILNQTHFHPNEVIFYNLLFVLTLITSPVMVLAMFITWLFFTVKSWSFVAGQLLVPSNQFLFYSTTAISKWNQFKGWFIVQLAMSLPLLGYGLFAMFVGVFFGHVIIPLLLILYVLFIALISALIYVGLANTPVIDTKRSVFSKITANWNKPFFSLFIYYVFDQLKVTLVVTKSLSYAIIIGGLYLLADVNSQLQALSVIVLGVVMAHTILIYQFYSFEVSQLSIFRNLPYSKGKIYVNLVLACLLLTLPENVYFLIMLDLKTGVIMSVANVALSVLFRTILYWLGLDMKKFIHWVFILFISLFMLIQANFLWPLIPVVLVASVILFDRNYYKQEGFIKL